ncbi:AAA domain-containing protein, partial [Escherichia coli]|nr:AAA domain-containing protein [Escherichia coli]
TALHAYCSGQSKKRDSPWGLIFPFGLNESQLLAVKRAFSSQISVIEGPPGTGKTTFISKFIHYLYQHCGVNNILMVGQSH